MRITLDVAKRRYGPIEGSRWPDEEIWCVFVQVPKELRIINSASGVPIGRIYCNRDMAEPLRCALNNVVSRGLGSELETFDGCLMIRDVRGEPGNPSTHSYALAIDFNAMSNPLGGPIAFSQGLVKCFTDAGFDWGGDFKRKDGMHWSYAWEGKSPEDAPT